MSVGLLPRQFSDIGVEPIAYKGIAVQAVRQTDNPEICLRQTRRFILAAGMRDTSGPLHINPDIAWMEARCEACGVCAGVR